MISTIYMLALLAIGVSAQDACLSAPYSSLSCFSNGTAAARICTSSLPTATASTISHTTVLSVATVMTTQDAVVQTTVSSTSYETSTVTITT